MLSKSVKISVLSLFAVAFAAEAFAQATINSMDQNADQSQGQYQPMDMGYAGFNSLGMMQSAWLDPLQPRRRAEQTGLFEILLVAGSGFAAAPARGHDHFVELP